MPEVAAVKRSTNSSQSPFLDAATLQQIQLELIRRRQFHDFDGQRVVDCLLQHRDLWEAVMMDRVAISHPGSLPMLGLMKLRDFAHEEWNVDTLYILTKSKEDAEKLAGVFNRRQWGGMLDIHTDPDEVDAALGGAKPGQAILSIWWE
ncbi:MAG: hypothetical protein H6822_19845 [Planctomycetaceae bacterium]|nr:hypothetical protein [Planctomycetales bacterium]MCB9924441.1 hypothetical protein [Planctomycetaceae bacterium]